jgi:hypothetical protein
MTLGVSHHYWSIFPNYALQSLALGYMRSEILATIWNILTMRKRPSRKRRKLVYRNHRCFKISLCPLFLKINSQVVELIVEAI